MALRSVRLATVLMAALLIFPAGVRPAVAQGIDPAIQNAVALDRAGKSSEALAALNKLYSDKRELNPQVAATAKFRHAEILARLGKKQEAFTDYSEVARTYHGRIPDIASDALYRGGLLASEGFGSTDAQKEAGEDAAWTAWKQLRDEYRDTPAFKKIDGPDGPLQRLMDRIDARNARHWQYQIIAALVNLTGKNPDYSYGLALILLAILVKVLLFPLTLKQYASMREMHKMQPHIKELQKKYKGAELQQKTMEAYKEHGVNPFAGCIPTLFQLPFLLMVFTAVRQYEVAFARGKFLWIGSPLADKSPMLMGQNLIGHNLASPDIPLLTLYVVTNYITMRMTPATDPNQQQQQSTMALMTSGIFFYMFLTQKWSSAFVLYWLALNLLSIWQQYVYVYKPHKERQAAAAGSAPAVIDAPSGGNGAAAVKPPAAPPTGPKTRVKPRKKR